METKGLFDSLEYDDLNAAQNKVQIKLTKIATS